MARRQLISNYNRFLQESEQILYCFRLALSKAAQTGKSCMVISPYSQEMCVIRLQDAWGRFCRELVISSASDRPTNIRGQAIKRAPAIQHRSHVIPTLISSYPNRSREPNWYVPLECIDAAKKLRVANLAEISAGIGATPSPADDLRQIRNFMAHRGKETADKVRGVAKSLGLPSQTAPLNIVAHRVIDRTAPANQISVLESWINGLRQMGYATIQ